MIYKAEPSSANPPIVALSVSTIILFVCQWIFAPIFFLIATGSIVWPYS